MDLDEWLFSKVSGIIHARKIRKSAQLTNRVTLIENQSRFAILASALCQEPIEIFPAEKEGGYRDAIFFLPQVIQVWNTYEENFNFYIYRILYLSIQKNLGFNYQNAKPVSEEEAYKKSLELGPSVISTLLLKYPNLKEQINTYLSEVESKNSILSNNLLYGKWMLNTLVKPPIPNLQEINLKVLKPASQDTLPSTMHKARAVEEMEIIQVDKKAQEDYVLTHNFEKVETAEEFNGTWRDFDGSDELNDHKDALDELNMKWTVRVDDPTHSVYHTEFRENVGIAESADIPLEAKTIFYPEWDVKKQQYRQNYCKLFEFTNKEKDIPFYQNTLVTYQTHLNVMRKMLSHIQNKKTKARRQPKGDEIDLDAAIDYFTDIQSRHSPNENIYIQNSKKNANLFITLLLDISLSSEAYVEGKKILEIEKEVAIIFGEILHEFEIDFCIACFYSKTRNYSAYQYIKRFEDHWDQAKYRIGAIEATGYTRIGTSLRHAAKELNSREAKSKWLLLLSDGKPNDYDHYEGKYGLSDVRKALIEMHGNEIKTYAFAVEKTAKYYLPQMFGQNHFQILPHTNELLNSMVKLFDRMTR